MLDHNLPLPDKIAILVASGLGCRVFNEAGEREIELAGKRVGALAAEPDGGCLAIVDEQEIWRRQAEGQWSKVADTGYSLQSIVSVGGMILGGGMNEAAMVRVAPDGETKRLHGFDHVPGHETWFAGGPPLGVRSLAATADGSTLLAAVHVGGIPRSEDAGDTWMPTLPVNWDVHEVCAHPALPNLAAAATAVGLCVSQDAGLNWRVFSEGIEKPNSLAVAMLEAEVLFCASDGPFAERSQAWRWRIGADHLEPVRSGLPEWLNGKVDTGWIASGKGRAAILDGGGNLWLSATGSSGWERIATGIAYSFGLRIV